LYNIGRDSGVVYIYIYGHKESKVQNTEASVANTYTNY